MLKLTFVGALVVAISCAVGATTVTAAMDPIKERKAIMKEKVLKNWKVVKGMAKGKVPYDGKAAAAAFADISKAVVGIEKLFPKGSETGGKTTAKATIWTDMKGFTAKFVAFRADTAAAAGTAGKSEADLKAAVGKVGKGCGGCHKAFRVKKKKK